tara:strand:- start:219 stop:371 length:153 start_codon:yes stop_codon:yes gene_type:complete
MENTTSAPYLFLSLDKKAGHCSLSLELFLFWLVTKPEPALVTKNKTLNSE